MQKYKLETKHNNSKTNNYTHKTKARKKLKPREFTSVVVSLKELLVVTPTEAMAEGIPDKCSPSKENEDAATWNNQP